MYPEDLTEPVIVKFQRYWLRSSYARFPIGGGHTDTAYITKIFSGRKPYKWLATMSGNTPEAALDYAQALVLSKEVQKRNMNTDRIRPYLKNRNRKGGFLGYPSVSL